jgi:hypothetical protein
MDQTHSVFMPGLTRRGPVYNTLGRIRDRGSYLGAYMSGLPALPSYLKYGIMAGLVYLGYKKQIPLMLAGGAAIAVWQMFPDASAVAAQGSGPPTALDISNTTAGAANITVDPTLAIPALSGYFIGNAALLAPKAFINTQNA